MRDSRPPEPDVALSTRNRIKAVAADLYVLNGYDGFSFAPIADEIGVTRANIHHHFGNKRQLMAELIDDFAADAEARIAHHWTADAASLAERVERQLSDLRAFYRKFNPRPGDRHVWSPVSRLRLDLPVLGDLAVAALDRVNRSYAAGLTRALEQAIGRGELRPETPVADLASILRISFLSCGPITLDTASFAEVERLFGALTDLILRAWAWNALDPARRLTYT